MITCQCGRRYRTPRVSPIHCPCRFKLYPDQQLNVPISNLIGSQTKAQAKMDICRSNRCGHYVQEKDACGVLLSRGKAGAITYLIRHPHVSCVAENPLFGKNL